MLLSSDIEETLDVWKNIKSSLVYTPDILEYATECHFLQLLDGKEPFHYTIGDTSIFLFFKEENYDILDRLYYYILSYLKHKKIQPSFTKESFYQWCFRYSFVYN